MHETHADGDASPCHQDARDPAASAPAFDDDGSGNLQQKITNEENSRAQAENAVAEAKVSGHFQAREADVDAIEIRNDVENEQIGQQAHRDAPDGAFSDGGN